MENIVQLVVQKALEFGDLACTQATMCFTVPESVCWRTFSSIVSLGLGTELIESRRSTARVLPGMTQASGVWQRCLGHDGPWDPGWTGREMRTIAWEK